MSMLVLGVSLGAAMPAAAQDTEPPQLVASEVTPAFVNIAYAAQKVSIRLHVTDETSAEAPLVYLRNEAVPAETLRSPDRARLVSGTDRDGWWETVFEVHTEAPRGPWQAVVSSLQDGNDARGETQTLPAKVTVSDERVELGFRWRLTGSAAETRRQHTATRLAGGRVLVVGGRSSAGTLATAEVYDPVTGTWSPTGSMSTPRYRHTATRLPSGKVLVVGGAGPGGVDVDSAEIYTPSTGAWTPVRSPGTPRQAHSATLLGNGRVLVAGGWRDSDADTASAEIYDPATGGWAVTGAMPTGRSRHTESLLPDGRVLVTGGERKENSNTGLASTALFDPASGTWKAGAASPFGLIDHTATSLPDGRVLVVDGSYEVPRRVAMFNPATRGWAVRASIPSFRGGHTASLMGNGKVLVVGGRSKAGELFDPATNAWKLTGGLIEPRSGHTATVLPSGKVLFAGDAATAEVVEVDMKAPAVQPPSTTLPVMGAIDTSGRVPLLVGLSGSDAMTKPADLRWTVQERFESAGTWSPWASFLALTRYATPGRSYQHQARAADEAGNVSAFVAGPADRVRLEQETAAAPTGAWEPAARSGASGGSVMTSSSPGATLRFPFTARRAAVVLPLRADLGSARICIDPGTPAGRCFTRDLSPGSGHGPRKLVLPFNVIGGGDHVMSVAVSSGRVDVDGLALIGG